MLITVYVSQSHVSVLIISGQYIDNLLGHVIMCCSIQCRYFIIIMQKKLEVREYENFFGERFSVRNIVIMKCMLLLTDYLNCVRIINILIIDFAIFVY